MDIRHRITLSVQRAEHYGFKVSGILLSVADLDEARRLFGCDDKFLLFDNMEFAFRRGLLKVSFLGLPVTWAEQTSLVVVVNV
jgi:hypothetical protein